MKTETKDCIYMRQSFFFILERRNGVRRCPLWYLHWYYVDWHWKLFGCPLRPAPFRRRNLCGSTTFFVFAGNWIPVEMDWFPLNFWKYGSHGQNRQRDFCYSWLCYDFPWDTGKKTGRKLCLSMVCGGICEICFQTWDDVSMCGLCSGVLSAKNLLVWSGNFSDLVSGFCRWSGLWILAGN